MDPGYSGNGSSVTVNLDKGVWGAYKYLTLSKWREWLGGGLQIRIMGVRFPPSTPKFESDTVRTLNIDMITCRACLQEKPETEFFRNSNGKSHKKYYDRICKTCKKNRTRAHIRQNKQTLVNLLGGKCSRCGYDKCSDAYDFHHIDPNVKEFQYNDIRAAHIDTLVKEIEKCVLLCKNCHAEVHYELRLADPNIF